MVHAQALQAESRVAVLVDCDNTSPEVLEHALRVVAQFGRVVLRRGYGNHTTLANKWQEALVRLAFTPCLQYQYAAGKNTSDIALALDAMEALVRRPRRHLLSGHQRLRLRLPVSQAARARRHGAHRRRGEAVTPATNPTAPNPD